MSLRSVDDIGEVLGLYVGEVLGRVWTDSENYQVMLGGSTRYRELPSDVEM